MNQQPVQPSNSLLDLDYLMKSPPAVPNPSTNPFADLTTSNYPHPQPDAWGKTQNSNGYHEAAAGQGNLYPNLNGNTNSRKGLFVE